MSEQISKALLKIISDTGEMEATIGKIDAAIFVRNSEKIINEKIAYLYNLLISECNSYSQKSDDYYDKINEIIAIYKQKLNNVYDEFYNQYVNIQNELQDARINKKIFIINYQKMINNKEKIVSSEEYQEFINKKKELLYKLKLSNNQKEYNQIYAEIYSLKSPYNDDKLTKDELKDKNKRYDMIINVCKDKFEKLTQNFEKEINQIFLIETSLKVINENNIVKRIINKIKNIFNGKKNLLGVLNNYINKINQINEQVCVEKIKNDTLEFVTDILEIREFGEISSEKMIG